MIKVPSLKAGLSPGLSSPTRSYTGAGSTMTIPRPLIRVGLGVAAVLLVVFIWSTNRLDTSRWDASTAAERNPNVPSWRDYTGPYNPGKGLNTPAKYVGYNKHDRPRKPDASREGETDRRANPYHPGKSRKLIEGSTDKYEEGPLPSLNEAFAFLVPRLNKIKDEVEAVPREHNMGATVFAPYLNDELKARYAHLGGEWDVNTRTWVRGGEKRYLFVTVCRQVAGMLPDWFAAWTVVADFLGPESLVFSLHEGDSDDGSGELIAGAMRAHLLFIGVPPENIFIRTHLPKVDWENHHRIAKLAELRNDAMEPIFKSATPALSPDGKPWSAIVFYNDVYLGAAHYLELLHQHFAQDADMTCGWDHAGKWFYDGWVGRDMSGDLYTPFPVPEEEQKKDQKLFVSHGPTRERHVRMLPYQVFAGWNGMVVMNPTPFLAPYNVRFRRATPRAPGQAEGTEECQASESAFISWDFWSYGFGRVQTVPGVHLTYGKDDARLRGFVEYPAPDREHPEQIDWDESPPSRVRCHDWPDKLGKSYWAWDKTRWVAPPKYRVPEEGAGFSRHAGGAGQKKDEVPPQQEAEERYDHTETR